MGVSLVTGGAGFIGSHLVAGLLERGDEVRVLDDFSTGKRENLAAFMDRITLVEGSLNDAGALARAVGGVEVIFHEAALASVPRSVADPVVCNYVNVTGTVALLCAAREAGVRRVVFAASSSAYGESPEFPKTEAIAPQTLSPYAASKVACEMYMQAFDACYALEAVRLRYFNVFGPRQDPQSQYAAAIPLFITAIMEDRKPAVYGDGEQSRDFTYVKNVVQANLLAADAAGAAGKVFNIGCGESVSVNVVIAAINKLLGKEVPSEFLPERVGDVRDSQADISLAREALGYEPEVGFAEGLEKTVEFFASRG